MNDIPRTLADIAAEVLEKGNLKKHLVRDYFIEYFLTADSIECLRDLLMNETWYLCLRRLYESTSLIEIYGFLVEADVEPLTERTYEIDLTGDKYCCVCPKYTCASDLGHYVKLTNLVNEDPVDVVSRKWTNKYAARRRPMPTEIAQSLRYGYDYVTFPKRKVKVTFSNTHSTETARAVFYADYMELDLETAINYMVYLQEPFVRWAERIIKGALPDWMIKRKYRREELMKALKAIEVGSL